MKRGDIMARKSKSLTPLQKAYRKERNRILQFIRRAEKRGYQFSENIVPKKIPDKISTRDVERLKRKTPEKLYKKAVYGGEATQGEIVKGTKGLQLERKAKAKKASETRKAREALRKPIQEEPYKPLDSEPDLDYNYDTEPDYDYNDYYGDNEEEFNLPDNISQDATFYERVVLENFRKTAREFIYTSHYILSWLQSCIMTYGEHETAVMIQNAAKAGLILGITVRPSEKEEKVASFLSEMLNYMAEAGDFSREQMMEMMESMESYEPVT